MVKNLHKNKVKKLVNKAKEKNLIKTYDDFLETDEAKKTAVAEDEIKYYTSLEGKVKKKKKFNIRDIVFVTNYKYKNGKTGTSHIFVIIDDGQAVNIDYFGFLLSSQVHKINYPYNEELKKDSINNLNKDSIVKCDDLIKIEEVSIQFKIGEVTQEDLERFIKTFEKYLSSIN
ncbi:MAG: hypothetical protein FWF46_01110 [Oscillospiraceae bacterium]|nr:hypothetical protein [Oscillospiraceae bacterium]